MESILWAEAHVVNDPTKGYQIQTSLILATPGRWCFIDRSWKDKDLFSGQGWYRNLPGFDGSLKVKNVRACLSPFHFGGRDINLGNEMYEEFKTVLDNVCNGLFSVSEDGFGTRRMTSIWKLFGRHQAFKRMFSQIRYRSCTPDGEPTGA